MLTLFYTPSCYFCRTVINANEKIGAPLTLRDSMADPAAGAEAVALGGRLQTPFLYDSERGIALYESMAIIAHLDRYYGEPAPGIVPVPTIE